MTMFSFLFETVNASAKLVVDRGSTTNSGSSVPPAYHITAPILNVCFSDDISFWLTVGLNVFLIIRQNRIQWFYF